jgi:collagenase-like PrtC family protease
MKKIELLAPAGSLPNLKAAVSAGADSVYMGMTKFNAREFALNFNEEYLKEAIQICKSNNVKAYLAANTLIKNNEIDEFFEMIKYAYEAGIDSVIIQDPSFIGIIRKSFPGLRIHLSTQAGIMNSCHANLFESDRINVARELRKNNIESIRNNCKKEIEMFVHGALCACVSGSCLFSSLLGGRSGNRGKCAQPCRKRYNDSFILSTKELCLLEKLPEIIRMKIDSLKIEGRMRTPYYVATVTSIYRKAIDSYYTRNENVSGCPKNKSACFFGEGKFKVTPEMRSLLESAFSREFTEGKFSNQPVFNPKKAAGTSNIERKTYEVSVKPVNFEKRKGKIELPELINSQAEKNQLIVRVYNERDALIASKYADIICLDIFNSQFSAIKKEASKPVYAVTPRIMFDSDVPVIKKKISELKPDGLIAGNLGILSMNLSLPVILDYNSNCFNDFQVQYYAKLGAKPIISPELSLSELSKFKNKDFIVFVHGKIRLMTLAHKLPGGKIRDEKGFSFYTDSIQNGAEIINAKELGLFNKIRGLIKSGINQIYIDTDNSANLEKTLRVYSEILSGKQIDTSYIQRDYVLGWSKIGVL